MVNNNLDYLVEEANQYGIKARVYRNEDPRTRFLSMKESVEVKLISKPHPYHIFEVPMLQALCATWNLDDADTIYLLGNSEKNLEVLRKGVTDHRLEQYLENFRLVFRITGIPRYMTHQIVRHRDMSFSQESMRVVDCRHHDIRLPDDIAGTDYEYGFKEIVIQEKQLYASMIDDGINPELARSILPQATLTYLIMSCHLGSLVRYLNWREGGLAQPEHQYIAKKIFEEFKEKESDLYYLVEPMLRYKE